MQHWPYGLGASSITDFEKLRNDATNTACTYKTVVLPTAIRTLQGVKEFIEYFEELSYEDCLECAEEILQDARKSRDLMMFSRDAHKQIAVDFKCLEDTVDKVKKTCAVEAKYQEEQARKLRQTADSNENWAAALLFVPGVNVIAFPLLMHSAASNRLSAVAKDEEANLAVAASVVLQETLQPALSAYCHAMDTCAKEFQQLVSECETLANNTERFNENKKPAFYKKMRARATVILESIKVFNQVIVAAETDLECLPIAPGPNYVQEWLAAKRQDHPSFLERMQSLSFPGLRGLAEEA